MAACEHLEDPRFVSASTRECAECVAMGSSWVHLRLCLSCGHVGCCDSSPNRHATKHFQATGDPAVRSIEPGDTWAYCYVDDLMVESL